MAEVQAERATNLEQLVTAAEEVRVAEGLPPTPEPQAPPRRLVPEDMTLIPPEGQARALGQAVENRLLELKLDEQQARANAAVWEAFFETTSRKYGVRVADILADYGIDVRRMSKADLESMMPEALRQGEESGMARPGEPGYRAPRGQAEEPGRAPDARQEPEDLPATVAGGRPAQGWVSATRASRKGRPIELHRGAAQALRPEDFRPDSLGWASDNPSAGLGVWFTPSRAEASTYGEPQSAYVDIRNPKVLKVEDLPGFNDVREAIAWREELRAQGFDSLVVTAKHIGGKTHVVVFEPEQVIPSAGAPRAPGETLFQSEAKSQLVQTAKKMQERWYSELERQLTAANIRAAPAKGWKDYLKGLMGKGSVKAEELKWSGLEEWLDLQNGRVTKDAVVEFLKQRGVKVEEVMAGGEGERSLSDTAIAEDVRILNEGGYPPDTNPEDGTAIAFNDRETGDLITASEIRSYIGNTDAANVVTPDIVRAAERVENYWNGEPTDGVRQTKYSDPNYQMPGGKNYRELLLTLPVDPEALPKGYKIVEVDQRQRQALEKNLNDLTAQWKAWLEENDYPPLSADDFGAYARSAGYGGVPREHVQYAKNFERAWNDTQSMLTSEARYALEGPDGTGQALRSALTEEQAMDQAMTLLDNKGVLDRGTFRQSHWDMSNVLAHVRYNERTDADGARVLFVEEIQSDWAQKGRKGRIRQVEALAKNRGIPKEEADKLVPQDAGFYDPAKPWEVFNPKDGIALKRFATELEARVYVRESGRDDLDYTDGTKDGIPAAPFVGKTEAWLALTLKRMIREAAERGFDKIAWTTGEQQTARYTSALRKAVDQIEWTKTDKGVQLVGYKGRAPKEIADQAADARETIHQYDLRLNKMLDDFGDPRDMPAEKRQFYQDLLDSRRAMAEQLVRMERRSKVVDTTEKEDALSDAIGKAMADRILNDPNPSGTIEGEGIVVSDTGMAAFYDRIVPNIAKQVLKDLGVPKAERVVGTTKIETARDANKAPEFKPFSDTDTQAFQGAVGFEDGSRPVIAYDVPIEIDGEPRQVFMIADYQGVNVMLDADSEPAMVPWSALGRGIQPGSANAAAELMRDFWPAGSRLWKAFEFADPDSPSYGPGTLLRASDQQSIAITPELKERALSGMPLFQGPERGAIRIGPETVIGLFEGADASTFLHESGHLFLQITRDMAANGRAPLQALSDWAATARWLGIEGGEITRAQQEKFATTFERYLANGEAPTPELRSVFQQFRDWLVAIYKSLANIAEDIPDEIRGVLDRMLASERQDPTPKAEGPPRAEVEPPPPPGRAEAAGGPEARSGVDADWRARMGEDAAPEREIPSLPFTDPKIAAQVDVMLAVELGWEQIGGKRADMSITTNSGQPNFTEWIPKSEVWPSRPAKHLNEAKVRRAVEKARAGEKLGRAEQMTVDYLVEIANRRLADVEEMGGPEEWNATARAVADQGIEPGTQNVQDADAVARASEIDELAVERAAQKYENDDAAFMAEIRRIVGSRKDQGKPGAGAPEGGPAGDGAAPGGEGAGRGDPLQAAAERFVEANPERLIVVGTDADGNPVTKSLRQYLDDALEEAAQAREDVRLLEAAASCLYGRG
jgi:hypothetical protein